MHLALLIDEVLREILLFSSEDGPGTLGTLARCCRAWKDPALDYLWMRLSSPVPLLQLISSVDLLDGQYVFSHVPTPHDLVCFHSYAQRVKHITHCRSVRIHSDIIQFLTALDGATIPRINNILPSLRTARVSSTCDPFQQALSLSSQLHYLELDLGFRTRSPQIDRGRHFLEQVVHVAFELKKLSIRGFASKDMNNLISSMQALHALSLRTGNSLTHETLLAIAHFPLLLELEIHAGHLDVDSLASSLYDHRGITFPSLRNFHVRASATTIELFMNIIPTNTLQTLHIEAEDPADLPIAWGSIFQLICIKAANTLQSLTIEHHIELNDLDTDNSTGGDHTVNIDENILNFKPETQISFTTLKDLSTIGGLRRLIVNTTLPPSFSDEEMQTLVGWWPALEHLDLGSASTTGCVERISSCSMTLQSLIVCAQNLPQLTSLILPANANIACTKALAIMDNVSSQKRLSRITLGHPSTPNPAQLAQRLHRLFPSLIYVDGLHEHEEQWSRTRAALQAHRLGETL